MKRKFLALIMILTMCLAVSSCGGNRGSKHIFQDNWLRKLILKICKLQI